MVSQFGMLGHDAIVKLDCLFVVVKGFLVNDVINCCINGNGEFNPLTDNLISLYKAECGICHWIMDSSNRDIRKVFPESEDPSEVLKELKSSM